MCNYQLLVKNENGYLIRCTSCKKVKMVFGTIDINLTLPDLELVYSSVKFEYQYCRKEHSDFAKCYHIALTGQVAIILNWNELEILKEMLNTSLNLIDLYSVLEADTEEDEQFSEDNFQED